eukprot:COSAG06_NODE_13805_length_1217_cov_1.546512_1_plen_120_part_00
MTGDAVVVINCKDIAVRTETGWPSHAHAHHITRGRSNACADCQAAGACTHLMRGNRRAGHWQETGAKAVPETLWVRACPRYSVCPQEQLAIPISPAVMPRAANPRVASLDHHGCWGKKE